METFIFYREYNILVHLVLSYIISSNVGCRKRNYSENENDKVKKCWVGQNFRTKQIKN